MKQKFFISLLAFMLAAGLFVLGSITSEAQDGAMLPSEECVSAMTKGSLISIIEAYGLQVDINASSAEEGIQFTLVIWGNANESFPVISATDGGSLDDSQITILCNNIRALNRFLTNYEAGIVSASVQVTAEPETGETIPVGDEPVFLIEGSVLSVMRCTGNREEYTVVYVPQTGDPDYPEFTNTWILVKKDQPARYIPLLAGYATPVQWDRQNEGEVMYVFAIECD
jgi:hypothetical protein